MYGLFAYKEITALRTKHVYRLEIYKKDFSGTTMELEEFSSSPFSITLEGEGDEIYRPIIKSSLSINIIDKDQFDYTQFFTSDAFGFRVFLLRNGVRLWSGYITPDSFGQDLQYRSTINLVARDNIGYLSEIDYDWFDYDFVSIEQLLTKAFDKIQAQFSLDNRVNIFSGSKPITDAYIQTVGLKDKTWFEVLEEVLSGCGLQLRYINDNYTLHDIANEVELGGNYTPTFIDRSQRVDFSPAWREEQLEQDYLKLDSFYDTIIKSGDYDLSSKITTYTRSMDGQTEGAFVLYLYKQNFWYNANLVNGGIYVANPADAQSKYDYDYTVDAWVTHKKNSLLISSYNRDIDPNSFIYKWFYINKFSDKLLNIDISAWNILYHYNQSGGGIFYPVLYRGFSYYVEFTFNIFLEASEGLYCYSSNGWYSVPDFDTVQTRIILTGTESGYDVIINGSKQYTTKLEELNIQIGYAPFDGKLIVAIYKWTARNPDNDDIYGDDVIDQGYCMRIDNIKMYFKDEKEDISGQESKITINESNNVKQSFDFKYGQIPDSSGGYLAFAGGLHDNDDYHTPLTDWYRSAFPGNKYNLLELVGRGLAHHGKKARKIMTGTILFDGQDFSKILVIDNEKYVINGGTYDVTKETLTGEFIEVEPYSTDDYVITGGAVSGGSSNISTGGNRDTLLWTDNAANTKRVNELGMATSDDLAGSNLLIDNPEWSEAKRISADMLDDKFYWDKSLDTTEDKSDKDSWIIRTKHSIVSDKGISAYGLGSTSGGSASGSLGELVNVGQWADEVPTADRVMVQLAGATHWSAKPLADLVGLDTAALAQYLTANSYLKASDISSYLTWANLSGKPTVYPTSWELVTGRPTKLSDLTDDVVAGNYLPKPTWDAVFEVVTVDGTPALKVKYDILGLKGITAYAEGSLSGGFSGALVDLVDVAVTNLASGDILKYNGTHFVNVPVSSIAGASSWDQITGKPEYYPTRWADVSGAPTSLPASDVYPWAKAASKPTYTAAEVGAVALNGGGDVSGSINASAYLTANTLRSEAALYPTISFVKTNDNSESLLIVAGNNLYYRPVASDATNRLVYHSGNFNPSSKLDKSVWDEAFELKTVNGVRVISAKLDFLSVAGISAYATGPSSGGGGGGLDYDLLKQALTGAITPDGYPFTISALFLGAIDKTYLTGKLANTYANKVHTHLWADITDRPTSLPANGGNADTVDNLHASSFTRADQSPAVDLNTVNGQGIMACGLNEFATAERHYPIQQAGTLFYGTAAYNSACQIYGTFQYNRWFVRGGGTSPTAKTAWAEIWTTVNFNPDNYLPLSGGSITGGLGVSGYLTAGSLKINETGSVYPQILFTGNNGNSSLLFVNAISRELVFRPADGVANDGIVYHSKNLTKLSQLTNDVVPSWALATTNHHLPYDDTRNTNYAPYNSNISKGLTTVHLKNTGIDGLADGGYFHSSIYITPWMDASGGHAHNIAFTDNGNMWMRHGTASWSEWVKVYHSGNSNLSTVDWSANNLNAAANLDVAGQAYVSGWLRSRGDVGWYSQDYGGGIHMTDSTWVRVYGDKGFYVPSNLQVNGTASFASSVTASGTIVSMSTVESRGDNSTGILPQMLWHIPGVSYTRIRMASDGGLHILNGGSEAYQNLYAQNLTAKNTLTATKLVIGGITIDVYNGALRVNGNLVATGGVTAYQ